LIERGLKGIAGAVVQEEQLLGKGSIAGFIAYHWRVGNYDGER
jgi:hypothetical protein